jgi:serine phosphatase RsbU (regulator of sigma subunit)
VGGDFYDAVELGDGRLLMFMGDVMGRGVAAAAAMAQVRAAVRAYAAIDPSPARVLGKLDRMFDLYGSDQLVTLLYLLADPDRDEVVIGNAGHPPPVLVRCDGTAAALPSADGPPLGVGHAPRSEYVVRLDVSDTIVAFTDGLIERRGEDITDGQDRLTEAVKSLGENPLDELVLALVERVGDPSRDDDIAVLAVRRLA